MYLYPYFSLLASRLLFLAIIFFSLSIAKDNT